MKKFWKRAAAAAVSLALLGGMVPAAGADVIMTAHITPPNATADGLPASLSYTMLTERLRGELGFTGVICTDALGMKAITDHYSAGDAAVAALNVGADLLLMPSDLRGSL